eukprot:3452954-Rhodomonas_salina.1
MLNSKRFANLGAQMVTSDDLSFDTLDQYAREADRSMRLLTDGPKAGANSAEVEDPSAALRKELIELKTQ